MAEATAIDAPLLPIRSCSVQEHCRCLRELKTIPFWWYQGKSRLLGNYSLPFEDSAGNWWFQVKPGLCWPVQAFTPIEPSSARPSPLSSYLGYQHVIPEAHQANSHLVINAIHDLSSYGPQSVDSKRRNAIRKGFRACRLEVLTSLDEATAMGCLSAWNDLSARSGWKHGLVPAVFAESWRRLLDCPGVSVIVGRDAQSGEVAGFLMTKIIGDTAYVDTIASRTEMLRTNVNDAVMYAFLINAAKLPGVVKGHYAIKSYITSLEAFKTGLGFVPHPFPARLKLRAGLATAMKLLAPSKFRRLTGQMQEEAQPAAAPSE